jgi:transcriptional regulator with XRE-family HTH domain
MAAHSFRMTYGDEPPGPKTSNEWVIANVKEAMDLRRWTQAELAERLGRSQPWLSKRLSGTTSFQIEDLDALAHVFGLTPQEWICAGYGKWERRVGDDRRSGSDRRRPKGRHPDTPFLDRESPRRRHNDTEDVM